MNSSLVREANALLQKAYASESRHKVSSPSDIFALPRLQKERLAKTERFIVVTLNGCHEVIKVHIVTTGLINRSVVHPREVFRPAILDNACAIIVVHNHPSGSLSPSTEDNDVTSRLQKVGDFVGIPVLDHLIISKSGFHSFAEHGELPIFRTEN